MVNLTDLLTKFAGKKEIESAVGVDIGSSAIKVVQIKKKHSKAVLETYGTLSLGPYANQEIGMTTNLDTDTLAKALVDTLRESNVTSKDVAMAIPASASLIFNIEIPGVVPEKDIGKIIPTEARKYIPVPIGEVTLDWSIIPQVKNVDQDGAVPPHQILLAAIQNDTLAKYKEIAQKASLMSGFYEIEIFSSIRSSVKNDLATTMIIDFGALKTKIAVMEYGIVRTFHLVNKGSRDITSNMAKSLGTPFARAEEMKRENGMTQLADPAVSDISRLVVDQVFREANTTLLNYEKKHNKAVSKVILSGGGSMMKGFVEEAKRAFHSEVELSDPFDKTESPAFLEDVLAQAGPEFAVAVGLALRRLQS